MNVKNFFSAVSSESTQPAIIRIEMSYFLKSNIRSNSLPLQVVCRFELINEIAKRQKQSCKFFTVVEISEKRKFSEAAYLFFSDLKSNLDLAN